MSYEGRWFGNRGEMAAAAYLEGKGMKILFRQKRTPFGEIDLVCLSGSTLVFVEVKTRKTLQYGPPQAAITARKFRHMAAAAHAFLMERQWMNRPWRLDVVAVYWPKGTEPKIMHFPAIDSPARF